MPRLTIIIIGTITVIATHSGHIHLIEHSADNIFLHTWRMAQRVLHGIDFRGAPLNHENIGIYEARASRERPPQQQAVQDQQLHNHICFGVSAKSDLAASEASISVAFGTRELAPAGKNAMPVVGSRPDRVFKIKLSSHYIEKSGARIRRQRARKRRMAKVTIQLK